MKLLLLLLIGSSAYADLNDDFVVDNEVDISAMAQEIQDLRAAIQDKKINEEQDQVDVSSAEVQAPEETYEEAREKDNKRDTQIVSYGRSIASEDSRAPASEYEHESKEVGGVGGPSPNPSGLPMPISSTYPTVQQPHNQKTIKQKQMSSPWDDEDEDSSFYGNNPPPKANGNNGSGEDFFKNGEKENMEDKTRMAIIKTICENEKDPYIRYRNNCPPREQTQTRYSGIKKNSKKKKPLKFTR